MRTEHEKYLYIFTPTTVLEFRLDYAYLISSEEAEQELVKMAESLQKGIVPSELALTPQENEKIEQESMRRMASDIKQLLKKYKQEHTFYVWENIENCPEPLATQATSPEFKPCLEQIEKYLLTNSFNHYNAQLLSNFFINASGQEDFYDPNFNTEEIEIIPIRKPYEPRICFKATIVSDYVARSLEDDQYPPQYVDGYPMFTREGTVDLSCRENPTKKECYYCTN